MKKFKILYLVSIFILGCSEEEPVYDQAYLDILAGEWSVERLAYPEENIEFTNPEITFHFNYCNIREQKRGTCTGYYQVKGNDVVDFEFDVDRGRKEVYFDVVSQEAWKDDGFSFDQDTLGMDVGYFNVIEIATSSLILKGLTTVNDSIRVHQTEYVLRKKQ